MYERTQLDIREFAKGLRVKVVEPAVKIVRFARGLRPRGQHHTVLSVFVVRIIPHKDILGLV